MELNLLPTEYRELALRRHLELESPKEVLQNFTYVSEMFTWKDSPEGVDFWVSVYNARTIKRLPPIPRKSIIHKKLFKIFN